MQYGIETCDKCGAELKTIYNQSLPDNHGQGWVRVHAATYPDISGFFCPSCSVALRMFLQQFCRKE